MNSGFFNKAIILLLPVTILWGCSPVKHLRDDQYLLNKLEIDKGNIDIENEELLSYIKQRPNRQILGTFRFHLGVYNLVDPDKEEIRKKNRREKREKKNQKRIAKGKKPRKNDGFTFNQWFLKIGEPPVIYDSTLADRSARQLQLFLHNKGYFHSEVRDSVYLKKNRAWVYYLINPGKPYRVRNTTYNIEDGNIRIMVTSDSANSMIKPGVRYDVDLLTRERERITERIRYSGYYYFNKEYIYFEVDSALNSNQVDINIGIKNPVAPHPTVKDSIVPVNHKQFYLNEVYIQTDFRRDSIRPVTDTLRTNNYTFIGNGLPQYKPNVLLQGVFLYKGDIYRNINVDRTYKKLSGLGNFKFVNIYFKEVAGGNDHNLLDAYIILSPTAMKSFTFETEGTHTSGNLGLALNIVYRNKNTFKGAELLEVKLKGAVEAQKSLNFNAEGIEEKEVIGQSVLPFNTWELGPEISLTFPKFLLPVKLKGLSQSYTRSTTLSSIFNIQKRPDYQRLLTKATFGYNWRESSTKRHIFNPLEISIIDLDPEPSFQKFLENQSNPFFLNSFTNHLISATSYSFIYNNQRLKKLDDFFYLRANAEIAGNSLRIGDKLIRPATEENGSFEHFGIIYAQYAKTDVDFRYYRIIDDYNSIVFRTVAGVGLPYGNLNVLPFEKSFFAGGANGIRAWKARSLGPGSFAGTNTFDQIGDIRLEGNVEYRFDLTKVLEGALFADAGNIWLIREDPTRPGALFEADKFYKDFAVGVGLGARFNFNFFIIRLDAAIPLRDPAIVDNPWVFNKTQLKDIEFNLGIGYPF